MKSAAKIDRAVERALAGVHRALTRGDITDAQAQVVINDLARWSATEYSRLPQAQATDAILGLLLGKKEDPL
ncbi:MAG TPA: hypothetical protein VJN66_08640 [Rhodanobacteraceae bacterium]|nr:hypothetical protein [Rhodanobacteraceae bacterium]